MISQFAFKPLPLLFLTSSSFNLSNGESTMEFLRNVCWWWWKDIPIAAKNHAFTEEIKASKGRKRVVAEKSQRKTSEPSHHGPWCPPWLGYGGVWLAKPPFLLRCFLLYHAHPWYLTRFDRIGSFWPSSQASLIFKALKIFNSNQYTWAY